MGETTVKSHSKNVSVKPAAVISKLLDFISIFLDFNFHGGPTTKQWIRLFIPEGSSECLTSRPPTVAQMCRNITNTWPVRHRFHPQRSGQRKN